MRFSFRATVSCFAILWGSSLVIGCGSSASTETDKPKPSVQTTSVTTTDGSLSCTGSNPSATVPAGLSGIRGRDIKLYDSSRVQRSLCDLLLAQGKKTVVFQWAGVLCDTCQTESKQIESYIVASPHAADMIHVVVLDDKITDYTDADYQNFMAKFAPAGVRAHDDSGTIKNGMKADAGRGSTDAMRPAIIMNVKMEGLLTWQETWAANMSANMTTVSNAAY